MSGILVDKLVSDHRAADIFLVFLRHLPLPPGPWVLPYAGDTLRLIYQGLIKISTDRQAIYGPIHRTWILGERNVFIADAACVRKILNGEHTIAEGVCCDQVSQALVSHCNAHVLSADDLCFASCKSL